jgi:hypothetical protein
VEQTWPGNGLHKGTRNGHIPRSEWVRRQGLEPRTRRLRVCWLAIFVVSDSAGKCCDVPGCTANRDTGCRVVPPATGPYRDIRANMEQTCVPLRHESPATVSSISGGGEAEPRWLRLGMVLCARRPAQTLKYGGQRGVAYQKAAARGARRSWPEGAWRRSRAASSRLSSVVPVPVAGPTTAGPGRGPYPTPRPACGRSWRGFSAQLPQLRAPSAGRVPAGQRVDIPQMYLRRSSYQGRRRRPIGRAQQRARGGLKRSPPSDSRC